jgi:uncharacterized protein YbaP (TraB family)
LLLLLTLAGCARPEPVKPALWLVVSPKGEKAWLFGTIHALPAAVDWRSSKVDTALSSADRLVLEVADIDNDAQTAKAFAALAQSPGLPPLDQRIAPDLHDELSAGLKQGRIKPGALDSYETWAAALMLQSAAGHQEDTANGIDRDLARSWRGPIDEFEGAAFQLAIFDRLAEVDQREMLNAVLTEGKDRETQMRELQSAWAHGDMDLIARVTDEDLGKAPRLREALLLSRNRVWVTRLEAMLAGGARPFVAVGAAHLAGTEGLPSTLAARGWKVTRLQ